MILLDTCTFLWLVSDQDKLSLKAKRSIKNNARTLFISSISAFEIGIKVRNKKIELPMPVLNWFSEVLDFHGIHELPVISSVAAFSVELPKLHSDPCDRIIIATAKLNDMKIITSDKLVRQYKEIETIW